MSHWKPISTYRQRGRFHHEVDLWLIIGASPLSMGMADAFRVTECYRRDGKWFHIHDFKEKELDSWYITHWMPMPKAPNRKTQ